jgi:hypothetical protein
MIREINRTGKDKLDCPTAMTTVMIFDELKNPTRVGIFQTTNDRSQWWVTDFDNAADPSKTSHSGKKILNRAFGRM